MPDSLSDLEKRRSKVLAEISTLGDFRPGSISATGGRCGTPNCHCHKPDDPGHGPNFRLTYKVNGKTVTESFPNLAAQRKAEREVAGFRTYRELSRTLIDTNEKICRARPVEDTLTPPEKNGGNDPSGSRTGSKHATASRFSGPAQDWRTRFGSGRDGDAGGDASGRSDCAEPVTTERSSRPGRARGFLPLRPESPLPRDACAPRADCRGRCRVAAPVVSVSALSSRTVPCRRGSGH